MKIKPIMFALLISTIMFSLTSCARNISSGTYVARQVGEASTTYAGVIRSVREVCVDEGEYLGDNQTGLIGGGVAGGLIGSQFKSGIGTIAGAAVGALGGSMIEKKMKRQNGLEYVVDMEYGGLMTVVQGLNDNFYIGQPVYVIVSQGGRSRIIPQ